MLDIQHNGRSVFRSPFNELLFKLERMLFEKVRMNEEASSFSGSICDVDFNTHSPESNVLVSVIKIYSDVHANRLLDARTNGNTVHNEQFEGYRASRWVVQFF